ncbi:HesA/MoeB/ThiF family protein, partial [Candidatus Nanopusillus massiliensis]|uniref:HesA/MoeB/ThiF family protein n=1 Tax=Candidatus Nanopusillus massiliensis TaxID=2897163 RepID=UPI001E62210D
RYISQIKFFGFEKNKKIQETSVAIIGLGGLGSWLSEFLVRIGVKNLAIVDFDIVEEKNLNRQNFIIDDIGKLKIDSIEKRLKEIDNNINIEKYKEINSKIFNKDIIFDCTDNIKSKYLINELSVYYNKPYIFASV